MTGLPILAVCAVVASNPLAAEAPRHGQLSRPEYRLNYVPRHPLTDYHPQPGDVVFSTTDSRLATARYALALTWRPTHVGIVVRMASGELGVLEAGGGSSHTTRTTTVPERFARATDKAIWVRRPHTPLTPEQSASLSEFATAVEGRPYANLRQTAQGTMFRTRGPIRTFFIGGPRGLRDDYICSEAVLESLVWAGIIDARTTRPSATFPRDMFFDRSSNPYIHVHSALRCRWEPPALWVRDCDAACRESGPEAGPLLRTSPPVTSELLDRIVEIRAAGL